jgi:hypothetical protein
LSSFDADHNVNTSSVTTTPSPASQTSFALSIRSVSGPGRSERHDDASEVRRLRHAEHEHHHDHGHRASRRDGGESSGAAFTTLKLKIEETFSSLTGGGGDGESTATDFEGQFKARFQFSGPEGQFVAKLKFKLDSDSATGGADFASAIQGFTQTLFAALNTLYRGDLPPPAAPTPPAVAAVAAGAGSGGTTTPALPSASTSPTPAIDTTPVSEPAAAAITPVLTNPPPATPPTPASGTGQATTSFSIKFRATYDSFESNLGPLVNQLAQPNLGDAFPALTSLLNDLNQRFGELVSRTPAAAGTVAPSLNDFLKALSTSFFGTLPEPAGAADATDPSTGTATDAAATHLAVTAPSVGDSAATESAVADPASPSLVSTQRATAMVQYQQVLTYSDAGSSLSLRTSLSARMVYEVA